MKELKPIHNEEEYELALAEASIYFDKEPVPGTKKADRFEMLLADSTLKCNFCK